MNQTFKSRKLKLNKQILLRFLLLFIYLLFALAIFYYSKFFGSIFFLIVIMVLIAILTNDKKYIFTDKAFIIKQPYFHKTTFEYDNIKNVEIYDSKKALKMLQDMSENQEKFLYEVWMYCTPGILYPPGYPSEDTLQKEIIFKYKGYAEGDFIKFEYIDNNKKRTYFLSPRRVQDMFDVFQSKVRD